MITIITDENLHQVNLSNHVVEQKFVDTMRYHMKNKTGKVLLVRPRDSEEFKVSSLRVKQCYHEERTYYPSIMDTINLMCFRIEKGADE